MWGFLLIHTVVKAKAYGPYQRRYKRGDKSCKAFWMKKSVIPEITDVLHACCRPLIKPIVNFCFCLRKDFISTAFNGLCRFRKPWKFKSWSLTVSYSTYSSDMYTCSAKTTALIHTGRGDKLQIDRLFHLTSPAIFLLKMPASPNQQ